MSKDEVFGPFTLVNKECIYLFMSDNHMVSKMGIFQERNEGWEGNGYDWTSIAVVLVTERLSHLEGQISFDPEAGMFSAQGSVEALRELGKAMQGVYNNDEQLRDLLSRAELD